MKASSMTEGLLEEERAIFKIVALYALFGALWIFFSDTLLAFFVKDLSLFGQIQTYKGWFYVAVTTIGLYVLIHRDFKGLQVALRSRRSSSTWSRRAAVTSWT